MSVSIVKPTVGGDVGNWGNELNAALDALLVGVNDALSLLDAAPGTYATQTALTTALNGISAQLGTLAASVPVITRDSDDGSAVLTIGS